MLKTEDDYGGGHGWGGVTCGACERAPAVLLCKADAASLCAACDAEIHSANPLARRHHRVPIAAMLPSPEEQEEEDSNGEEEAASWLLMNPLKNNNKSNNDEDNDGLFLLGVEDEEDEEYLRFVDFNGCGEESGNNNNKSNNDDDEFVVVGGGDSVVPMPIEFEGKLGHHQILLQQSYGGDVDDSNFFHSSSKPCYSYNVGTFPTHPLSVSSMEVGVVPESTTTTISDISISNMRPPKGTIDLFSGTAAAGQMPATQLSPVDREARVLRYREKKKTRKFEKTIRYASRKAYAETRPRIKGRFAKRTDVEVQLGRKFSNHLMADAGYGIVPSFRT